MKVRSSFVSNSSTTSFFIYGIGLETSDFTEVIRNNCKEMVKGELRKTQNDRLRNIHLEKFDTIINEEEYDDIELCDLVAHVTNFEIIPGPESEEVFLGKSPNRMNDYEIVGDWKKNIQNELENFGFDTSNIEWKSEAWENR